MVKEKITAMSDEHTGWLSALDFYKQELNIIKGRLTEVAGKNTSKEAGAQVEHFENQIKVQHENIDTLRHGINDNLAKVAAELKTNTAGYIGTELVKAHDGQKETFTSLEKVINELRQEFNRFATQWM
jgi:hypothetical protein